MKSKWILGILAVFTAISMVFAASVAAYGPADRPASAPGTGPVDEDGDGVYDLCGRSDFGSPAWGRMGGARGGRGIGASWRGMGLVSVIADRLEDVTIADLVAEIQAGKTLREVITDHGLDVDEIVAAFLAQREAALDELVEAGRLTAEQAEWMLDHMEEEILEHLDEAKAPCGFGRQGGRYPRNGSPSTGFGRRSSPMMGYGQKL